MTSAVARGRCKRGCASFIQHIQIVAAVHLDVFSVSGNKTFHYNRISSKTFKTIKFVDCLSQRQGFLRLRAQLFRKSHQYNLITDYISANLSAGLGYI